MLHANLQSILSKEKASTQHAIHTILIPSKTCPYCVPYASCNDCCILHSTSAGADPELADGGGG